MGRRPNKFDDMIYEFCAGHGFCGSVLNGRLSHVSDFIPQVGMVSADEFVRWILKAEGLEAYNNTKSLKAIFIKHMGADKVDAKDLRSSYRGN